VNERRRQAYPRLTHPLVRDSRDEEFRRASRDEALDRVARGLRRHRGAFGMLSCARATNETNYLAQKFARAVMGTHNVDSCDRGSHAASVTGLAAAFGAGAGTSSYGEIEQTDVVVLWGSNARVAHPVFFQHVLKGVRAGARLYVVDPRRTSTAEWAEGRLALNVGTDIALAHAIGREIIQAGLVHERFVGRATSGFEEYRALVEPWTLSLAQKVTGVPAPAIRELAHTYARAERAQLCWTLGVTGHRDGTDNVRALIDLALLTGHVGRPGSGLQPLYGPGNVQGVVDMGAVPHRLPGFQDVRDPDARLRFESAWNTVLPAQPGLDLAEMFEEMETGGVRAVYCVGEDPASWSEGDGGRAVRRLKALDFLVVQDAFRTSTAELADVVLPAASGRAESEGTTTNGERRVRRIRKAAEPPGEARADVDIIRDLAGRLGHVWAYADAEAVWNELRSVSPDHYGMTYRRLEEHDGLRWPCPSTRDLEPPYPHGRLWEDDPARRGRRAPFGLVPQVPPADLTDERFPIRLTTGRRLDSPVPGGSTPSPSRLGACVELCPEDAERYGVVVGEKVRITSRHGSLVASVWIDTALRPGLAFTTLGLPHGTDADRRTPAARCPIAGAAEYRATAIRVDKLPLVTSVG